MASRETDSIPDKQPSHHFEWKGSSAEVYEPLEALQASTANEIKLYDRSDFQTPIERVQVSIQKIEVEGETCTAMTARIRLDRTRDDYNPKQYDYLVENGLMSHFIGSRNAVGHSAGEFVPYTNKDNDLNIEETVFSNVFKVAHTSGAKVLVWVDTDKKMITISNNLSLSSTNQGKITRVEVNPPADGTVETADAFEGFLKAFMRTMDFTAGLADYTPATHHLNRTYPIGKERTVIRSEGPATNLGHSALSGAGEADKNPKSTSVLPEELGIEVSNSNLSLDDVGGLEQVKKSLRDIAISFQHPEIMAKWGAKRPQGILMYGAPGTGKTMLAKAFSNEVEAELWSIQSSDIYEKWLGNSESHIKDIFDRARSYAGRLILFFDEFDSIVGITDQAASGADNARNAVAGIFKQEMNTLASENPDVLVIAATNDLDRIDPALIRSGRFDHKVYVPMPDQEARQQIITNIAARSIIQQDTPDFKVFGDDLDVKILATEADGMSGADITEIFRRLSISRAMQEARTGTAQTPISQEEIKHEFQKFRQNG